MKYNITQKQTKLYGYCDLVDCKGHQKSVILEMSETITDKCCKYLHRFKILESKTLYVIKRSNRNLYENQKKKKIFISQ